MMIEQEHFEAIYALLLKNLSGLTIEQLWTKCKIFENKVDLSRCLHRATQLGELIRTNYVYTLSATQYEKMTGNELPEEGKPAGNSPISQEIAAYMHSDPVIKKAIEKAATETPVVKKSTAPRVHRVEKVVPPTPLRPLSFIDDGLKTGRLKRGAQVTSVALAIYYYRDKAKLRPNDICKILGKEIKYIHQIVQQLKRDKYVRAEPDPTRLVGVRYVWSGVYRYPIKEIVSSDINYLSILPKDWVDDEKPIEIKAIQKPEPVAKPTAPCDTRRSHRPCAHCSALLADGGSVVPPLGVSLPTDVYRRTPELIDNHIALLKQQIVLLEEIRSKL